jgi:hypothetical protein
MPILPGLFQPPVPGSGRRLLAMLTVLLFLSACAPSNRAEEELQKEIQALKTQVTAIQEKLNQLQAGQQVMLELLKKPAPMAEPLAMPGQVPAAEILRVEELLASKDRYLGARVKVKGMAGPVMVHHKSLMLKSAKGMLEVVFGNLPDPKMVQNLSSTPLDKPITVTGMVNLAPARGAGAQMQLNAEAVEF